MEAAVRYAYKSYWSILWDPDLQRKSKC